MHRTPTRWGFKIRSVRGKLLDRGALQERLGVGVTFVEVLTHNVHNSVHVEPPLTAEAGPLEVILHIMVGHGHDVTGPEAQVHDPLARVGLAVDLVRVLAVLPHVTTELADLVIMAPRVAVGDIEQHHITVPPLPVIGFRARAPVTDRDADTPIGAVDTQVRTPVVGLRLTVLTYGESEAFRDIHPAVLQQDLLDLTDALGVLRQIELGESEHDVNSVDELAHAHALLTFFGLRHYSLLWALGPYPYGRSFTHRCSF
jgi:hypothetical protein